MTTVEQFNEIEENEDLKEFLVNIENEHALAIKQQKNRGNEIKEEEKLFKKSKLLLC